MFTQTADITDSTGELIRSPDVSTPASPVCLFSKLDIFASHPKASPQHTHVPLSALQREEELRKEEEKKKAAEERQRYEEERMELERIEQENREKRYREREQQIEEHR